VEAAAAAVEAAAAAAEAAVVAMEAFAVKASDSALRNQGTPKMEPVSQTAAAAKRRGQILCAAKRPRWLPRSAATAASLFLQCVGPPPAVEEDFANIGLRCHFAEHQQSVLLLGTAPGQSVTKTHCGKVVDVPGPLATENGLRHRGRNRTNSNCSCDCPLLLELSESQAELQRSHTPKQNGKSLAENHLLEPTNPDSSRRATAVLR
jgi:hypothetical protein